MSCAPLGRAVSVGFDGYRVEDYLPGRVVDACRRLEAMEIPLIFGGVK